MAAYESMTEVAEMRVSPSLASHLHDVVALQAQLDVLISFAKEHIIEDHWNQMRAEIIMAFGNQVNVFDTQLLTLQRLQENH